MYYREPRSPSPREQDTIKHVTHLAGIAIQRKLAESGPARERSLSRGSTTAQPYRELGMGTGHGRNQVLVGGNLSRAWFRSRRRAAAIRNIF